ncbi:MAG: peptide deformylase [Candidatus Omnitrophota bacterium]
MITTKLKIRVTGDPCLRKKSAFIKEFGISQRCLVESMFEAMYDNRGVGLAAPQVGINEQIFVADIGQGPLVFINPHIIKKSGSDCLEEGCLSIPGVVVNVRRPKKITVRYLNENNRMVEREYTDLLARVILHETDHLNGRLIVDYAGFIERRKLKKQLQEKAQENPS